MNKLTSYINNVLEAHHIHIIPLTVISILIIIGTIYLNHILQKLIKSLSTKYEIENKLIEIGRAHV